MTDRWRGAAERRRSRVSRAGRPDADAHDHGDYGGARGRYGGSSSGGYGSGGSALDYHDVVGHREEYERRYSDAEAVFSRALKRARRRPAPDYRGRGPRNYRRSDDRIREDVCERLTDDPHIDAADIEVAVRDGEVTLAGTVMSRPMKRRADDIAESVVGVANVQNGLRIQAHAGVLMGGGRTTGGGPTEPGEGGSSPTVV